MTNARSVVWEGSDGKNRIGTGGNLAVKIQYWDQCDAPVTLDFFECDTLNGESGKNDPIGRIEGQIKKGKKGDRDVFWFEAGANGFEQDKNKSKRDKPWVTFNLLVPTSSDGSTTKYEDVGIYGGEFEDGKYEVGVRVLGLGDKQLEPEDKKHVVAAMVERHLNHDDVLNRWTPYIGQCHSSKGNNDIPDTVLGYSSADFDQLGCGHASMAAIMRYWGEFDSPAEFVTRAGLEEMSSVIHPRHKAKGAWDESALPYKDVSTGENRPRWTKAEILAHPNAAALLWTWYWRQKYIFKKFPNAVTLPSSMWNKGWIEHFPHDPDATPTPAKTYEVTAVGNSTTKILEHLCAEPANPVLWLIKDPGHYMTIVGFERYKGKPCFLVHDSGNVLRWRDDAAKNKLLWVGKKEGWWKETHPTHANHRKWLHLFDMSGMKKKTKVAYAIKRLNPPASVKAFP
ncbi:hypothetical protein OAX78_00515 [Planctomycetota bacterium]|nr:hypothetical protein [Planctomycetota bacterium]